MVIASTFDVVKPFIAAFAVSDETNEIVSVPSPPSTVSPTVSVVLEPEITSLPAPPEMLLTPVVREKDCSRGAVNDVSLTVVDAV